MGSEHPFNPVVSLVAGVDKESTDVNNNSVDSDINQSQFACKHADFVFTPYQYLTQMQAATTKDTQSYQGKNQKYGYRRPPPVLMDSQSIISQSSMGGDMSPSDYQHYGRRNNNYSNYPPRSGGGGSRGGVGMGFPNSPGGKPYYRNQAGPPNIQVPGGPPMFPMDFHAPGQGGYPGAAYPIPIFPPPPMQMPLPGSYPPPPYGYHNSLSSSLSSSYGASHSPLSQSPMNPSYLMPPLGMPPMPPPPHDFPQTAAFSAGGGGISPNTRKRSES
jgi:hypothetical protein